MLSGQRTREGSSPPSPGDNLWRGGHGLCEPPTPGAGLGSPGDGGGGQGVPGELDPSHRRDWEMWRPQHSDN